MLGVGAIRTAFRPRYYAGETAVVVVEAADATAVRVAFGSSEVSLASDGSGVWSGAIPTAGKVGRVPWTVFVTDAGGCVSVPDGGHGSLVVACAGASAKWEVVAAIDRAMQTWGTNPNRSISVGEISITYKSLDELLSIRAQYVQQAEAEERGVAGSGGVRAVEVRF